MQRILFNWYYYRADITEYLLSFSGEIELVFIFFFDKTELPGYLKGQKNVSVIYWGDYNSPYALLKDVAPDKVVFGDIESFNQIALNIAARNKKIKTFVLQHGLRGAFEVDEALASQQINPEVRFSNTSLWSLKFLLRSLRPSNVSSLPSLFRFIYTRKTKDLTTALFHHQFEMRRADYYIEFSENNASYHRKRDGVPPHRFIYTGNPAFDEYITYLSKAGEGEKQYCLLIDCPFGEAFFYSDHKMTTEKKNEYLEKLSHWSASNGFPLKVKLHPLSYGVSGLFQDENISYERETDMKELIANAVSVCFVHFSTLTPLIVNFRPSIYFHSVLSSHLPLFENLGIPVKQLYSFDERKADLHAATKLADKEKLLNILYATDGQAALRVKNALMMN